MTSVSAEADIEESSVNILTFISLLAAMTIGLLLAVLVLPRWMPGMAYSLSGTEPRAYWYLARASAFAAVTLLWISMVLGVGITNKMARLWPGAPAAFAIHEYVSLLGLAFVIFHTLILLGDRYIGFSLVQLLMPFSTQSYRPLWVGMGQLSFYTWLVVTLSFYVRKGIGQKAWRILHYAAFASYIMGLVHGIGSGTDSAAGWVVKYYWLTAGSLLFLFVYRVLASRVDKQAAQKPRPVPGAARAGGASAAARSRSSEN